MTLDRRQFIKGSALPLIALCSPIAKAHAQSGDGWYPLKGDDDRPVPNMRLPVELTSEIDLLPGIIWVGAKRGALTLYEFYDLNCPFCRKAAKDLPRLLSKVPDLRLGLINNAILSLGSVQAAKVELALLATKGPAAAYEFHKRLFSMAGMNDGPRALAVGESLGVPRDRLEVLALRDAEEPDEARRRPRPERDALFRGGRRRPARLSWSENPLPDRRRAGPMRRDRLLVIGGAQPLAGEPEAPGKTACSSCGLRATRSTRADMPRWPPPSLTSLSCSSKCRMSNPAKTSRSI